VHIRPRERLDRHAAHRPLRRLSRGRRRARRDGGYVHDFIDATRPIASTGETARSSHGGNEATAAMQASLYLSAHGIALTPKAGVDYVHLFEDGFSESGSPGFDLIGAHRNSDSLRPFIGGAAAKSFTSDDGLVVTPVLDLAYSHELMHTVPSNTCKSAAAASTSTVSCPRATASSSAAASQPR
jgi:outer membrane autotransporter protein